jgi:hypothetical protein
MCTRKDYERAAKIVRSVKNQHLPTDECNGPNLVREAFVMFFQEDNPRFDADRFREACVLS